ELPGGACVVVGDINDLVVVLNALVVGVHSANPVGRFGQISASGAQQCGGAECRVVNILWVGDAIAVAVAAVNFPALGNELHWSNRPIPGGVAIKCAVVTIGNAFELSAVQCRTGYGGHGHAVVVQC